MDIYNAFSSVWEQVVATLLSGLVGWATWRIAKDRRFAEQLGLAFAGVVLLAVIAFGLLGYQRDLPNDASDANPTRPVLKSPDQVKPLEGIQESSRKEPSAPPSPPTQTAAVDARKTSTDIELLHLEYDQLSRRLLSVTSSLQSRAKDIPPGSFRPDIRTALDTAALDLAAVQRLLERRDREGAIVRLNRVKDLLKNLESF